MRVVVDEKTQQTTDWSDSFSLDAIGSEGIFKCETSNESHVYQVKIIANRKKNYHTVDPPPPPPPPHCIIVISTFFF